MTPLNEPVVIVGAGLGGLRVAEDLRTAGYTGRLILIGKEPHPPYDRPPLSKTVVTGGQTRPDLKDESFYADQAIELQLGAEVVAVRPESASIVVSRAGERAESPYGTLILATGLSARPLPDVDPDISGVHMIRTIDDAYRLRDSAVHAGRAVVIGGGFIGCEITSSLRALDVPVTMIESTSTPLSGAVGEQIGARVMRLHRRAGVDIRTGVSVNEVIAADGAVTALRLSDGSRVTADLVVVGIGGYPELGYLEGSGIAIASHNQGGGIACDHVGSTSVPGVYALGDAANWADENGGRRRVEHWNHTVEQAAALSAGLLGVPAPPPSVPYFWSDQYGLKIQVLGSPAPSDTVHVVDDDGQAFLAYYSRDGFLTGVVGSGRAASLMRARPHLATLTPVSTLAGGT